MTGLFALTLGFATGLVFRGTENFGLLEWAMVLLAISAMATGYYIRGIEPDGDETYLSSSSHERSNVVRIASAGSPVSRARRGAGMPRANAPRPVACGRAKQR